MLGTVTNQGEASVDSLASVTCVSKVKMEKCSSVPSHFQKVVSFALLKCAYFPPNVYAAVSKTNGIAILQVRILFISFVR